MLGRCGDFANWDDVSKEILGRHCGAHAEASRGGGAEGQAHAVAGPLSFSDLRPRFEVAPKPKPRVRDVRDDMPPSLAGKKLSATLRNGVRLCAEYQRNRCRRGDDCEFRAAVGIQWPVECRAKCVNHCQPGRAVPAVRQSKAPPRRPPSSSSSNDMVDVVVEPDPTQEAPQSQPRPL